MNATVKDAPTRETIPLGEVAERTGLHAKTVYRLHAAGRLPFPVVRVGRRILVPVKAFDSWISGAREGEGDGQP